MPTWKSRIRRAVSEVCGMAWISFHVAAWLTVASVAISPARTNALRDSVRAVRGCCARNRPVAALINRAQPAFTTALLRFTVGAPEKLGAIQGRTLRLG